MHTNTTKRRIAVLATVLAASTGAWAAMGGALPQVLIGTDQNNFDNPFVQPQDPALAGGGRDQTLQFGDTLFGGPASNLLVGLLGTDILVGGERDDVIVGGPEHFNPSNRDRAFGGPGNDLFLWSPGDGSDQFQGGAGLDAVAFGLLGELDDNGDLFFGVSTDQQAGDLFFDPATGLPLMDVTNSPGFCNVIDSSTPGASAAEFEAIGADRLVQFVIRGLANSFEAGTQDADNGLRVTLHLQDVEFLICASRDGGAIEAFDLRTEPPTPINLSEIPLRSVQQIID